MPREREVRKRGKKHRKGQQEQQDQHYDHHEQEEQTANTISHYEPGEDNTPSWIRDAADGGDSLDAAAPFGFVDAEVKAYFREAYQNLKDLDAENGGCAAAQSDGDDSPSALLLSAALAELSGKELQLATDPDCSIVLEYLISHMGEKPLRVLMDRMAGNFAIIASHRFGSHVLQTALATIQNFVTNETSRNGKGKSSSVVNNEQDEASGVLRSVSQLILDLCEEIKSTVPSMLQDPFASHVLRVLLLLLSGRPTAESPVTQFSQNNASLRSKRSAKFRAKETAVHAATPMARKDGHDKYPVPETFTSALHEVSTAATRGVGPNEVRAMAISPVASPVLQLLLTIEAENPISTSKGDHSLSDIVLDGMSTLDDKDECAELQRSDHLEALLRDPIGSHLLERVTSVCPVSVLRLFWQTYIKGRVAKLGVHPIANFVVSRVVRRLDAEEDNNDLADAISEIAQAGEKLVKGERLGVLQAMLERTAAIGKLEGEAASATLAAFQLDAHRDMTVPVILSLKRRKTYQTMQQNNTRNGKRKRDGNDNNEQSQTEDDQQQPAPADVNPEAPLKDQDVTTQGSLLLQTMTKLASPHNSAVYDSLLAVRSVLPFVRSSTAVHVIIAAINSPTATFKQRNDLLKRLVPELHVLADDKWGSRVADACWDRADGFTKEKMATTLLSRERFLAASYYGGFFARRVNLALFRRNPQSWRQSLTSARPPAAGPSAHALDAAGTGAQQAIAGATNANKKGSSAQADKRPAPNGRKRQKVDEELEGILNAVA